MEDKRKRTASTTIYWKIILMKEQKYDKSIAKTAPVFQWLHT